MFVVSRGIQPAPSCSQVVLTFVMVSPGERIGIVGPNGAGKSSLLDLIAGGTEFDSGEREVGDTTVLGYFAQHPPDVDPKLRIIDYISSIADKRCAAAVVVHFSSALWEGLSP